ncbi:YbaY family lipoprotein [Ruegeria sp. EL01]|jgi:putative lipoprotein|uniref:YbaY family lipoprotein n=1 Tax=Ruegeria sp. EL01 TaxID=2107578 RepID=UPI000EA7FEAB|nr:YbaY family lipoprotein [Ruegeria sp. EL01]
MLGTRHSILGSAAILATLASAAFTGTVEGSATYRERIAVPPDATLFVELQDVSLADAPAVTLAAQRYALSGVPAGFELSYDDALVQDNHSYVLRASITQGEKLLFTTDTAYPVLTNGAERSVDLTMVQVQAQGEVMLEDTQWTAVVLNGAPIETDRHPELSFTTGGAFSGFGGCNRFNGQAEVSGNRIEFPDNMAATLMACPPPLDAVERQFLKGLQRVTTYAVQGNALALLDANGEAVVKFSRKQ